MNLFLKQKIGIVGFGQFGKFMYKYLERDFDVRVFEKKDGNKKLKQKLADLDYLILAVPFSAFEEVCKTYSRYINRKTIIIDVTSVKVKPIKLMRRYFSGSGILGTHPIFGPQSGKDGIAGLSIVLTNVSLEAEKYASIKRFLQENLQLNIIEKSAEEHDKEMAYVQGLSHFIGRAIQNMKIKDFSTATKGYRNLLNLKETVGYDSWDLYKTIQNANPFAKHVRKNFLRNLKQLEMGTEN